MRVGINCTKQYDTKQYKFNIGLRMVKSEELLICNVVNRKLSSGEAISDEELSVSLKHLKNALDFIEALQDKSLSLFCQKLQNDYTKLKGFKEERKRS